MESEGGVEEEAVGAAGKSVAPENDGGRDEGLLAVAPLRDDEDGECSGRAGEETYDARGVPRVRFSAVLHRLEKHDCRSQENDVANKVEFYDELGQRPAGRSIW